MCFRNSSGNIIPCVCSFEVISHHLQTICLRSILHCQNWTILISSFQHNQIKSGSKNNHKTLCFLTLSFLNHVLKETVVKIESNDHPGSLRRDPLAGGGPYRLPPLLRGKFCATTIINETSHCCIYANICNVSVMLQLARIRRYVSVPPG